MSIADVAPLPTVLFAAFATLAVTGCAMNVSLTDDTTRRIEHDTVPAERVVALDVTTDNGAIEIRGGGGDEILIRTVLQESNEGDADYSVDVDGDRLVLVGECDSRWWEHCQVGFVVTVPTDLDVTVETDNGRVDLADVAGDVRVDTDNGAIDGSRLRAQNVKARTDNGRIRLTFDEAPLVVVAETDNGAISVLVPDTADPYMVDADSDNGSVDVDVRTDPDAARRISARSDNGAIEVEYRAD